MLTLPWFRSIRFALDSLRRVRKQQLARRRPWLEELEPRLAPATVQFSAASETINEAAGTFSIPVTLTGAPPTVSTFASGFESGGGTPSALAFDAAGNLYVADSGYDTIDKVTPAGVVSTFASGFESGGGTPVALAFDAAGNLYVADSGYDTIDKVTPAGVVSTFASGFESGGGTPSALAFDTAGNLYVADSGYDAIDKVTPAGVVSTFATGFESGGGTPSALAFDAAGNLYVADSGYDTIDKVTPAGVVSTFASGFESGGGTPVALAFDAAGNLYVADSGYDAIDKVTPAGVVSTFASGFESGGGTPSALAFDTAGNLYVADSGYDTVDKATPGGPVGGPVSVPFTLGGTARSGIDYRGVTASPLVIAAGQTSGTITGTLLSDPGPSQTLTFTLDTPSGASLGSPTVNTLTINELAPVQFSTASETIDETAGTFSIPVILTGTPPPPTVRTFASGFSAPYGLAFDAAGNLYVANGNDSNSTVDKVTPAGVVSTFASGFGDPDALAFDTAGNLYVANGYDNTVSKVTPAGVVRTFASGFSDPNALAFDAAGNLYVANGDNSNSTVDKVTPAGVVSTFASGFDNPDALAFSAGNLYVANYFGNTVSKVTPAGVVSTFASGLSGPDGLAFDAAGNLYVANYSANSSSETVSKVTPAGVVSTFVSNIGVPVGLAFDAADNLYVGNFAGTIFKVSGSVSMPFTLGGTARSGIDYRGVTASPLVIAAGQTSATITGTLLSDPGASQTLTFTLDTPSGASLGSPTVNVLTIDESSSPVSPPPVSPPPVSPPPVSPLAARQAVALGLTQSTEYYTDFITNAYNQYLGRAPDAVGLAYWLNLMQNHGLSDERLEAGFIGSTEYISDHGGPGQGWIVGMYQNLLGRTPAPSEVDYWMGQLANNVSTADIAYGFAASQERESDRVTADYEQYLDRGASNSEITYWVNVFLNGGSNEQVIAGFVCSQEYFQDHGNNNVSWLDAAYRSILNRAPDAAGFQYWENQLQ